MARIAVLPGDGIGKEVAAEGVRLLELLQKLYKLDLQITHLPYGADHFLATGETLPKGAFEQFKRDYDAIFLGALGDPRVPDNRHAREILLGMRFNLDLYINLRPCKLLDERLTPLKGKTPKDIDFVVFRENTEGQYQGLGGHFKQGTADEIALSEEINTRKGVERIIRAAFAYAKKHGKTQVMCSTKSNAIPVHELWTRVFKGVAAEYPDIKTSHMYVDALAMQMVLKPETLQVIVTTNLFGDILTDIGAGISGGLGIAASANLNPESVPLFEPVHGSAPDIAGKGLANPLAMFITAAMMLDHLGLPKPARAVEKAVLLAVQANVTTRDLGGDASTRAVADFVLSKLPGLAEA
jgi:3-isopropylmalate dehydrogenase